MDGRRLLGGILVGDASAYGIYSMMAKSDAPLPCPPHDLLMTGSSNSSALGTLDSMADEAQVCSCNNVSKGQLCAAIREYDLDSVAAVKQCTRAGTGCGGCVPMVTDIFHAELKKSGKVVSNHLCEHFSLSRTELFGMIKVKQLRTFVAVLADCGQGYGCETCKPAVASILASLWNEDVLGGEHQTLQDTNDRFLANLQRGGSYSVVPHTGRRDHARQIDRLGLRCQAVRPVHEDHRRPAHRSVWGPGAGLAGDLGAIGRAGFESGHAYGKALRTVKSCVGTTWCRYGVQDSVGFAIRVENRYKGIRSPHKIKMAVSGCVRECAEAQSKDVGLIATENGYNLYVCGNGGSKPRHAELLAADLDEETAIGMSIGF